MEIICDFPFQVQDFPDEGIVMPDGCRLSARIWRPVGAGPVPAILEYIPYRKRDGTVARDERMHPYFAGHGYAAVRVDMRGNGDSEGLMSDEYTALEQADAVAVIEWLAAQDWCSGSVGMMGKSWGGFNCLQVAALAPPALKAVVTVCSTVDRFADDVHFKGGCLLGENFGWGAVMLSYSSRPPDPMLRPDWRADWLARLDANPFLAPRWAGHQARDGYWKHGSICEDYSAVKAKVLSFSGWADNYMNTSAHLIANLPGAQAVVGPWVHQYPHQAVPGPQVGFLQLALRWWDRWLKDEANGAESDPALRAYVLESEAPDSSPKNRAGGWVAEQVWPPALGEALTLALSAKGVLGGEGAPDAVIATPQHLGLMAGEFFPMGLNAEMPGDQAEDDALSVCFDTPPLTQGLALLGAARLLLRLTSDQPLGFVVARLCDVGPDGSSVRIAHGMLNLCHRDSRETPAPLVPGQAVDVAFDLDQMGYRLAPGHRLRLALSNSYWPFLWPSPRAGRLTLSGGQLQLPLHKATDQGWQPPPAQSAAPWAHRVLSPAKAARRIERDLIDGTIALVVEDDTGLVENAAHGLATREVMTERWVVHPDDPTSAHLRITWSQNQQRGEWNARTEVETEMTSDATHLHMTAVVRAYEGDREIFVRNYDEQVPRQFI